MTWIALLLTSGLVGCTTPQTASTTIEIDGGSVKPISRYIYGINYPFGAGDPDWKQYTVPFTYARMGGNRMTAYNWETNASNAGNDFHHQNDNYIGDSNEPGWTAKTFMDKAQQLGAAVILTLPTAGYVSADKNGDGDVNKTPNYLSVRFHKSLSTKPGGAYAYPPNTDDQEVYQDEFVSWITRVASPKTPLWFSLDNEPDLWGSTHQRIWPKNPTAAQIIANNIEFGSMIKNIAPKAMVFGLASYGWNGYRTFQDAPDLGGRDFLDMYLEAIHAANQKAKKQVVDVLDLHWYPEAQGDGVRICNGPDKPGTPAARIMAPRSLWDPTYVETSWITQSNGGKPITLLPDTFGRIAKYCPEMKLSFNEYNYGGENVISGAMAQADVLGLFGRYGVFAAAHWGVKPTDKAILAGFEAFLNMDGQGAQFGDQGLKVKGEEAAKNAVYAAKDAKGRVTIVAINKLGDAQSLRLSLKGLRPRSARAFAVTAESLPGRKEIPAKVTGDVIELQAPKESVVSVIAQP